MSCSKKNLMEGGTENKRGGYESKYAILNSEEMMGGGIEGDRHFRVVELDGKKVALGGVTITHKASPGDAARKLLKSIAHEKGLKGNKKVTMGKVKYSIQEYTRGSKNKVYGTYIGYYHKYTGEELKKASTADGKIKFTMKAIVKLA